MNKNEKIITMGSNIIDLYMDGYDEGKDDNCENAVDTTNGKKRVSAKVRVSSRRKKAHFKAVKRMAQLRDIAKYEPAYEDKDVVHGMLRSHQLQISDPILTYGCSIGNKRRQDAAEHQLFEHINA